MIQDDVLAIVILRERQRLKNLCFNKTERFFAAFRMSLDTTVILKVAVLKNLLFHFCKKGKVLRSE